MANPDLQPAKKAVLVMELVKARRTVRSAKFAGNQIEEIGSASRSMSSSVNWASAVQCGGPTGRLTSIDTL
jgi:hypothetical protein